MSHLSRPARRTLTAAIATACLVVPSGTAFASVSAAPTAVKHVQAKKKPAPAPKSKGTEKAAAVTKALKDLRSRPGDGGWATSVGQAWNARLATDLAGVTRVVHAATTKNAAKTRKALESVAGEVTALGAVADLVDVAESDAAYLEEFVSEDTVDPASTDDGTDATIDTTDGTDGTDTSGDDPTTAVIDLTGLTQAVDSVDDPALSAMAAALHAADLGLVNARGTAATKAAKAVLAAATAPAEAYIDAQGAV